MTQKPLEGKVAVVTGSGRGIGKALLTRIEEWLWSEGWKEIWLTTDLDETDRAVGFYRHLGWKDWKIEKDRYMKKVKEQ